MDRNGDLHRGTERNYLIDKNHPIAVDLDLGFARRKEGGVEKTGDSFQLLRFTA